MWTESITRTIGLSCATAAMLLLMCTAGAEEIPAYILAAVADPTRPETDRERDTNRKPAEVIAFAGIKPGDKVADFMPGSGYFSKIFCKVVGDSGHVYAIAVPFNRAAGSPLATKGAPTDEFTAQPPGQTCTNVTTSTLQAQNHPAPELHSSSDDPGWVYEYWQSTLPAENFSAPEPLDVIWTAENYHDLHNKNFGSPDMLLVAKALLAALKPGGILIVEDHAAKAGSGARDTETLHRIDPKQVQKEMLAAGFIFVDESDLLRHADDTHTVRAHEMHDKTDRFLLRFRKP